MPDGAPQAAAGIEPWQEAGFGIYVHWPFCQAKCPYCDFNSHVVAQVDQPRWAQAFRREIARAAAATPGRVVSSVFFGGGTPSLMAPATVEAVLEAIAGAWPMANDAEITMEANPTSVEAERFRAYRAAGVGRISIGIQALNDADLKRLGRLHDAAEAVAAFDLARATFERVSFDLIYARQDQDLAAWRAELAQALAMGADHLSLYQLTIEAGTAFGDRLAAGRLRGLPDEDLGADLFAATQELCEAAGLPAYEISNHARPGAEARHNLIYWRSGDWIGLGPGAHGRLTLGRTRFATEAPRQPAAWLAAAEGPDGAEARTPLDPRERLEERVMMGLRLGEGVPLGALADARNQIQLSEKIEEMRGLGVLDTAGGRLRATAAGRPLLNAILARLLS